jgi:DNA-directed RNA polymerase subunit L
MPQLWKKREKKSLFKLRGIDMKIIKDTKNELEIQITGESHTLCNALRKTLMEDKDVESAAYVVEHPIIGEPKLYLKAKNPRKSLEKAAETLKSRCDELKDVIEASKSSKPKSKSSKPKPKTKSSKSKSSKSSKK